MVMNRGWKLWGAQMEFGFTMGKLDGFITGDKCIILTRNVNWEAGCWVYGNSFTISQFLKINCNHKTILK